MLVLNQFMQLFFFHRYAVWLARGVIFGVIFLLVYISMQWIWLILGWMQPPVQPLVLATPTSMASAISPSVANWHLLGNALSPIDMRSLVSNNSNTALNLILHGVFAGASPEVGSAIIALENGEERAFNVGDTVQDEVVLHRVYRDYVVLLHRGVLENLQLITPPSTVDSGAQMQKSKSSQQKNAINSPTRFTAVNNRSTHIPAEPVTAGTNKWPQDTSVIQNNLASLAKQVTALPVMEDGQFIGVRLSFAKGSALAQKIALKPTDIVTAVNGISIDSPLRMQEITQSLMRGGTASVTVRRNGKTETLTMSIGAT